MGNIWREQLMKRIIQLMWVWPFPCSPFYQCLSLTEWTITELEAAIAGLWGGRAQPVEDEVVIQPEGFSSSQSPASSLWLSHPPSWVRTFHFPLFNDRSRLYLFWIEFFFIDDTCIFTHQCFHAPSLPCISHCSQFLDDTVTQTNHNEKYIYISLPKAILVLWCKEKLS